MIALYREHAGADWSEVELVSRHPGGFVVREGGRVLPGVMLADWSQVREPVGEVDDGEPINTRLPVPVRQMKPAQRRVYRKLRTAGIERGAAFVEATR